MTPFARALRIAACAAALPVLACARKPAYVIPGRIVVGFEREVPKEAAERMVARYGLGQGGHLCARPRGIFAIQSRTVLEVAVPPGEEARWRARFKREPGVYDARPCRERDPDE